MWSRLRMSLRLAYKRPATMGIGHYHTDDPLKPEEALSQVQWQAANDWFDHTLYSRLNDNRTGTIVLVMHRLHEDDLVGHVLAQSRGRSCASRRSPRRTRSTRSIQVKSWDGTRLPGSAARHCTPSASQWRLSSDPPYNRGI